MSKPDAVKTVGANQRRRDGVGEQALGQAAECLKVLAHPHRLRIVELLLDRPLTVGELAAELGVASHRASMQLRLMQRCGFLVPDRAGRFVRYRIVEDCLVDFMTCIRKRFGAAAISH